ncbi:MAG: lytic transglycosylase domain-containing protein [Alphaproteobacteria bacterium]|nr:lytic transglycosylase domain-containing protein [Alphaproteobacteria bacterium]
MQRLFRYFLILSLSIYFISALQISVVYSQSISADDQKISTQLVSLLTHKKYNLAIKLVSQLQSPLLKKYFTWYLLTDEDAPINLSTTQNFLKQNPAWPGRQSIIDKVEIQLAPTLDNQSQLLWFKSYSPTQLQSFSRYAIILRQAGDAVMANKIVRVGWQKSVGNKNQRKEYLKNFQKILRTEDHERRLEEILWSTNWDAISDLKPLVSKPYQDIINLYDAVRLKKSSIQSFIKGLPPVFTKLPIVVFLQAKWYRKIENPRKAAELILASKMDIHINSVVWNEVQIIVRDLIKTEQGDLAYRLLELHESNRGLQFAETEWLLGWISYQFNNQPLIAAKHFNNLFNNVSSPISRSRAAYWSGRAYESANQSRVAQNWYKLAAQYSTTFYGQLAFLKTQNNPGKINLSTLQPNVPANEQQAFNKLELVQLIRVLHKIGQTQSVDPFFRHLLAGEQDNLLRLKLMMMLGREIGRTDLVLLAARLAYANGYIFSDYLYPIAFDDLLENRNKPLMLAIIRQESSFYQASISHKGAHGAMQLLPTTARLTAKKLGITYQYNKLLEASYNIKLGQAYFNDLLKRWDNSYILAIASYNAGPANVTKWIEEFGDPRKANIDPIFWIESIPFAETRNYVQRVLESSEIYRHKLNTGQAFIETHKHLYHK